MKISIVGLGLIGGSIGIDLRKRGFLSGADSVLVGVEENPEYQMQARNRGLVDEVKPLEEAISGSDFVILAVPVGVIVRLLPRVLDLVGAETTVTDMGSTKQAACNAVRGHAKRQQYVASHPMAGTEHSGPMAAVTGLFDGRTAVICDAEQSAPRHLRRVDEMFEMLGMRLVHMSSADHDLHAAYVSHLSHISSFVLANTVLDQERNVSTIFDLAGGGFESTVRLAKSSPEMWTPIFEQNREHVVNALGSYIEHLKRFHKSLVDSKFDDTKTQMQQANAIRRVLNSLGARGIRGGAKP